MCVCKRANACRIQSIKLASGRVAEESSPATV